MLQVQLTYLALLRTSNLPLPFWDSWNRHWTDCSLWLWVNCFYVPLDRR